MNYQMVMALIKKDFSIMKLYILGYWLGGVAAVLIAIFGGEMMGVFAWILFISVLAGAGIHAIMQTVSSEKNDQVLPFIMSLPITFKEYTFAKLTSNLLIFLAVWSTLSAASFIIFLGGLPLGTLPFFCIILLGILVAYTIMLCVSLVTEGVAWTIFAVAGGNVGTQMILWLIANWHPIRSVMGANEPVWNAASLGILGGEIGLTVVLLVGTVWIQFNRKDVL